MVVFFYFGLFGCGKIIFLIYFVFKGVWFGRYLYVYFNVVLVVFGIIFIDNFVVGKYEFCDCFFLIDEVIFFVDFRDFKNFDKGKFEYFLEYCYCNVDIVFFI